MDWVIWIATGLVVLVLTAPLLMLGFTVLVLAPLAHLVRRPTMIARTAFRCPFSRRQVRVEFITTPEAARPLGVHACSMFSDGHIRCEQGCCDIAETAWTPSSATPRFALIAGDTVYR
jgi:hypothetical protein